MLDFLKRNLLGLAFFISVIVIAILFIINWFTGNQGSFNDHSRLFWNMISEIPFFGNSSDKRSKALTSHGESECRRVAEKLTGQAFPKCRPNFLKNSITDANLELDCFCEKLGVAIEYNGRQHYEYVPHFHSSKEAFFNTRYRDEMKKRLCREHEIELIVVPYTVSLDEIEPFLTREFKRLKISR